MLGCCFSEQKNMGGKKKQKSKNPTNAEAKTATNSTKPDKHTKKEITRDEKLKLEAEKEAQEEMQVAFINLMNDIKNPPCTDDGEQSPINDSDAIQKIKYKWASGLDWNPGNPLMSNWMRVLAVGDFDGMMKEIDAVQITAPKEETNASSETTEEHSLSNKKSLTQLLERRETLYRISALFHVIKGATRTLDETGLKYAQTAAKFVDTQKAPKHFQCALKLLELGANVNARDMLGDTPLFYCFVKSRNTVTMKIAKILLDSGADVNAVNRLGETALIQPLMTKRFDCVKFLLRHGINPSIRDNEGCSGEALMNTNESLKQLLENASKGFSDEGLCAFCDQSSRSRCTGCYVIRYCGKECQLAHWKKHKKTCKDTQSQFVIIHLSPKNEQTAVPDLPKENFIMKVQSDNVNSTLTVSERSIGLLGVFGKESSEGFVRIVELLKAQDPPTDSGYLLAVVDKDKNLKVNSRKLVSCETW